jgi:hypothetical protein
VTRSETGVPPARDWTEPGAYAVAAGVFRIPLPLPQDGLRAVNAYAIVTGNEVALIDSGWALAESEQAIEAGARTAFDVAGLLPWTRPGRRLAELDSHNQLLAVLETMAHLDFLVTRGRLTTTAGPAAATCYARTGDVAAEKSSNATNY